MTTTLYGIKNCDTIKKAKKWLEAHNIEYVFNDYRQNGLEQAWLENTEQRLGWEIMVNKRGTTYRQLSDEQKSTLDRSSAITLMLEQPAIIKRPILIHQDNVVVGFKDAQYQEIFS